MKGNRVLSLLGLSKKAGRLVSGEFSTETAVKTGKACLVLVSREASENTKKKFRNMCDYYRVPHGRVRRQGGTGGKHRPGVPRFSGGNGSGIGRGNQKAT